MALTHTRYHAVRRWLLEHSADIIAAEQRYMDFLTQATLAAAPAIYDDFSRANDLIPFWINYSPSQRGRSPTGLAAPWSEVGQTTISSNLLRMVVQQDPSLSSPGIPFGGDVRFGVKRALLHVDVKSTGPNDVTNEVVAPPQQLSGDGHLWADGVMNSPFRVAGARSAGFLYQPKLPPFYVFNGRVQVCLTYFLKGIYEVRGLGNQPLSYLELVSVPNGLLLFDGPRYADTPGLLTPGKDDKTVSEDKRRVRVKLDPLARLAPWRCVKFVRNDDGTWRTVPRYVPPSV